MEKEHVHIVQSKEWGEVKTLLGTPAIKANGIQYTKHKIPFTKYFYGYCPKVNPNHIQWDEVIKSAEKENVIAINFDCPDITTEDPHSKEMEEILKNNCLPSSKQTFAKYNVVLDITKSEEELLANMHSKTRYNIKYAQKSGVTVKEEKEVDINVFIDLQKQAAQRQKFFIHPDKYYETIWKVLGNKGVAKLLIAYYKETPVTCWMLYIINKTLYYPYGGSSGEYQNLFPNNLVCWEAIKLGKKYGCETFDLWGASKDPNDTTDPWYGFTRFKLGFGGKHVEYINSYDVVINQPLYRAFNTANKIRWFILNSFKR